MQDLTCVIEGCDKAQFCRGWCAMHHSRFRRHGNPEFESVRELSECSVDGCVGRVRAHGMCNKHHLRTLRHGHPLAISGRDLSAEDRFLVKTNKLGPVPVHRPELGQCWTWMASLSRLGYGIFSTGGRGRSGPAHAWSYEHFVGPIGPGLEIDHLCRNRACVRPSHLEAVTHSENMRRAVPFRLRDAS